MSINSALSNAYSGLSANARLSEIVSRNVANAGVEGYAARSLTPASRILTDAGGGVLIEGPSRAGDAFLTADRRRADARAQADASGADTLRALADLIGSDATASALVARYGAFEDQLRKLADTPESPTVQEEAARAAQAVARTFSTMSTEAQRLRFEADGEIARQVSDLNSALSRIDQLNRDIAAAMATGRDATALEDERARQIDVVNAIVPIRAAPRDNGAVSLFTQGGGVLLETSPQPLAFTATAPITEDMSLAGGQLSDVTFNDRPAAPTAPTASGFLRGGTLEAAFRARDETIPLFTAQLDALARDLIERFQDPGVDTTLVAGEAGLFVDGAGDLAFDAADPAQQIGLARRIQLNSAVDPDRGGDSARMRDGLGAAAVPLSGDAAIARNFMDSFTAARTPAGPVAADPSLPPPSTAGFDTPRSATALAAQIGSLREAAAARAEQGAAFAQASAATTQEAELRVSAVDTDAELRNLLTIEQAYAANARVVSAVDEMMRRILEI